MSQVNYTTLMTYLGDIPDQRNARGRRYEWLYLLTLLAASLLAGNQGLLAMWQWLFYHRAELVMSLQPRRGCLPSLATLRRVLCDLDVQVLEERVAAYNQTLDAADGMTGRIATKSGTVLKGQAVDGKTVRGASAHGETVHLVRVVRHQSAAVLAQGQVAEKLDERQAAVQLLTPDLLVGTVTTMDALHTQRTLAQHILDAGGHYLMVVKGNQPALLHDIALGFDALPPVNPREAAFWGYQAIQTFDRGHGREEVHRLERTTHLNDYLRWPGVAQVLRRTRRSCQRRTRVITEEVHYGITSLPPTLVELASLEQLWRWHWTIENCVHYVRDVSFGEDRSQVRAGNAPQVLAAFRNALITVLHHEGWAHIPNALRFFEAHLQDSLRFLGAIAT